MKKVLLSVFTVLVFAAYAIYQRVNGPTASATSLDNLSQVSSSFGNSGSSPVTSSQASVLTYKDGGYVGSSADAFYGNVQVKAIVTNGKISDVQFLSYPNDHGHSVQINSYATPRLRNEAIQVQSANVDIVSGATATSEAFQQSLQSALSQAQ